MSMTENESINGWTFDETVKTAENLMKAESNMFKWDVLRHLRDFAENYKDELEAHRAIGTIEEFKALKEKSVAKKPSQVSKAMDKDKFVGLIGKCPNCGSIVAEDNLVCEDCFQVLDWQ